MTHRKTIAWGTIYFLVVFAVGFLLGILRVGFLEPKIGTRWAVLAEMPLMVVAIVFAAFWIVRRTHQVSPRVNYLLVGSIALAFLLFAEALAASLRGMSVSEYAESRDPVSGSAFLIALVLFTVMPWLAARQSANNECQIESDSNESSQMAH